MTRNFYSKAVNSAGVLNIEPERIWAIHKAVFAGNVMTMPFVPAMANRVNSVSWSSFSGLVYSSGR